MLSRFAGPSAPPVTAPARVWAHFHHSLPVPDDLAHQTAKAHPRTASARDREGNCSEEPAEQVLVHAGDNDELLKATSKQRQQVRD